MVSTQYFSIGCFGSYIIFDIKCFHHLLYKAVNCYNICTHEKHSYMLFHGLKHKRFYIYYGCVDWQFGLFYCI